MTLLLKDPDAVLDYAIDWGAEYLGNDVLVDSHWVVDPDEPGGVIVADTAFDLTTSTVKAGAGIQGRIYRLTNHVVLGSGRIDTRSIILRVEKR